MRYKVGDKVKVQTGAVWTGCTVLEAVEAEIRWGGVEGALLASGRFSPREPAGALSLRALGPIEIRHVVVDATSVGG